MEYLDIIKIFHFFIFAPRYIGYLFKFIVMTFKKKKIKIK